MQFAYVALRPADPTEQVRFGGVSSSVRIVASDVVIGPSAASESIGAPTGGITFDPLVNDSAGDAPLDPSSLAIVSPPPGTGTLTITGDAQLTYVPGSTEEDRAVYEICDSNRVCAAADLWMWQDPS